MRAFMFLEIFGPNSSSRWLHHHAGINNHGGNQPRSHLLGFSWDHHCDHLWCHGVYPHKENHHREQAFRWVGSREGRVDPSQRGEMGSMRKLGEEHLQCHLLYTPRVALLENCTHQSYRHVRHHARISPGQLGNNQSVC